MQETKDLAVENILTKAGTDQLFIVDTLPANDEVKTVTISNIDSSDHLETVTSDAKLTGDGTVGSPLALVSKGLTVANLEDGAITNALIADDQIEVNHLDFSNTPVIGNLIYYSGSGVQVESRPDRFLQTIGGGLNIFDGMSGTTAEFNTIDEAGTAFVSDFGDEVELSFDVGSLSRTTFEDLGTGSSFTPDIVTNTTSKSVTSANATINNPATFTGTGRKYWVLEITQGTGAPHTISWGTAYDLQGETITPSTTEGLKDIFLFEVDETNSKLYLLMHNTGFVKPMWTPAQIIFDLRAWVIPEAGYVDLFSLNSSVEGGVVNHPPIAASSALPSVNAFKYTFGNSNCLRFDNAGDLNSPASFDLFCVFTMPTSGDNIAPLHMTVADDATTLFGVTMYTQTGTPGVSFELVNRKEFFHQSADISENASDYYLISTSQTLDQMFSYGTLQTETGLSTTTTSAASYWAVGNILSGDGTAINDFITTGTEVIEVIAANPLGTADRQRIEGYLAWRTGTQADLDASHPYLTEYPYADLSN